MPGDFRRIGIQIPATATEREAMDVAFDVLSDGARENGERFERPDADWQPAWLVLTGTQGTLVMFDGRTVDKYEATEYVSRLARKFGAVAIGHLHSSWLVEHSTTRESFEAVEASIRAAGGSTEGFPRREILLLGTYSASEQRQYHAAIHRHEDGPPTLDPFELAFTTAGHSDAHLEGAMFTPLMKALRRTG